MQSPRCFTSGLLLDGSLRQRCRPCRVSRLRGVPYGGGRLHRRGGRAVNGAAHLQPFAFVLERAGFRNRFVFYAETEAAARRMAAVWPTRATPLRVLDAFAPGASRPRQSGC